MSLMGQYWHRSTGNPRIQIHTWTFHPTTLWPTRLQLSEHYTPEWNPSTPQRLTRMKRWNTSGKPSLPMVTPKLKLWYTTTQYSPAPGQWIEMTHRAQWSYCPMCRGCQRRCITEHAWGAHHLVDWDEVRVLDHQPHHHQRLILEFIHIRSQTRPLNKDTGSMPQIYNFSFFK